MEVLAQTSLRVLKDELSIASVVVQRASVSDELLNFNNIFESSQIEDLRGTNSAIKLAQQIGVERAGTATPFDGVLQESDIPSGIASNLTDKTWYTATAESSGWPEPEGSILGYNDAEKFPDTPTGELFAKSFQIFVGVSDRGNDSAAAGGKGKLYIRHAVDNTAFGEFREIARKEDDGSLDFVEGLIDPGSEQWKTFRNLVTFGVSNNTQDRAIVIKTNIPTAARVSGEFSHFRMEIKGALKADPTNDVQKDQTIIDLIVKGRTGNNPPAPVDPESNLFDEGSFINFGSKNLTVRGAPLLATGNLAIVIGPEIGLQQVDENTEVQHNFRDLKLSVTSCSIGGEFPIDDEWMEGWSVELLDTASLLSTVENVLGAVNSFQFLDGSPQAITVPATIVVSASDSVDPRRADSAFQCDGTDDEVEINNAIEAISSGEQSDFDGGTIILLEGIYKIGTPILLRDRVRILGQGFNNTKIKYSGPSLGQPIFKADPSVGSGRGRENTIEKIFLEGLSPAGAVLGIEFDDINSKDNRLIDLKFDNLAVLLNGSRHLITRCEFDSTNSSVPVVTLAEDSSFIDNKIKVEGHDALFLSGVGLAEFGDFYVSGNKITTFNVGNGVNVGNSSDSVITGNIISSENVALLTLQGSNRNILSNNILKATGSGASPSLIDISGDENQISGNKLISGGNQSIGVRVVDSGSEDNFIVDNDIRGFTEAIQDNGTGTIAQGNLPEFDLPLVSQTFTANGTWALPTGVNKVFITGTAGGGAGGGKPSTPGFGGSGGGAGGSAVSIPVTVNSNIAVIVGVGGAGDIGDGDDGSSSSFGSLVIMAGGNGGDNGGGAPGAVGLGGETTGFPEFRGDDGAVGTTSEGGQGGNSKVGVDSALSPGAGGVGDQDGFSAVGSVGAGGGGAGPLGGSADGGDGGPGFIRVEWVPV